MRLQNYEVTIGNTHGIILHKDTSSRGKELFRFTFAV